jgi:muramoyltetrapeptide carboxypeptidase
MVEPSRRGFLQAVAAAAMSGLAKGARGSGGSAMEIRRPRALRPGSRVALVAPASHLFDPDRYRQAEEVVRSLDLVPVMAPHARKQRGFLAGTDEERLSDLHWAFGEPAIDALWCLRGGYGSLRLLDRLDYDLIGRNVKPLIGYSDITALQLALAKRCRLVSFHGPMLNADLSEYALEEFRRVLFRAEAPGRLGAPPARDARPGRIERQNRITVLSPGRASGPLLGGNLSLVTRLIGTPYLPDLVGCLLFLEDVGEAAYRIDGMLSQLRLSGILHGVAGIVFGKFTEESARASESDRLPVETVLQELTRDLGVPVISGWMCGHVGDQTTVPQLVPAELDAAAGTVRVLEAAVVA